MLCGAFGSLHLSQMLLGKPTAWAVANGELALLVWLMAFTSAPPQVADQSFKSFRLARSGGCKRTTDGRRMCYTKVAFPILPVHFVLVFPVRQSRRLSSPRPSWLTDGQQCAIESALRLHGTVNLWIAGTDLPPPDLQAWSSWRKELQGEEAYFGELIVRSHRFNASTTIGRWLLAKGMGDTFSQSAWAARGWPSYGAIVSDLVRLDVLEAHGGIYLDTDHVMLRPVDPLLRYTSVCTCRLIIEHV